MSPVNKGFTPVALRFVLSSLLVVIVGLMICGFVYSYDKLRSYAVEVSHNRTDAAASSDSLQTLNDIQSQLKRNQQTVQRALTITATSELPQFEAIDDVQAYAIRNHLILKTIDFNSSTGSTTPATSQTPAATSTPVASAASPGVDVSITFPDEVNYQDFLQFLTDIENNIPKMQVQGITISKGSNPDMITSGPLTIHMYTN